MYYCLADMILQTDISSQVTCRTCSKRTCIACPGTGLTGAVEKEVEGWRMKWCCGRGRLFIIWVLLCVFDGREAAERWRDRVREAGKSSKGRRIARGSGVGYSEEDVFADFEMMNIHAGRVFDAGKSKAENKEAERDGFCKMAFSLLASLLPSPDGGEAFDSNPPLAVTSLLLHSRVLGKAAELLRNDSLDDATKRKGVYQALMGFLRTIGTHKAMSRATVFEERRVMGEDLLTLSFGGGKGGKMEVASSLAEGLRKLNVQSEVMLKGALGNKQEFRDQRGTDMLWLCRQISDLSTYLLGKEAAKEPSTEFGVMAVPESQILPTYYYAREAQGLRQSPLGRIPRLITEVTSLVTGLAAGIFVKHCDDRLDIMK